MSESISFPPCTADQLRDWMQEIPFTAGDINTRNNEEAGELPVTESLLQRALDSGELQPVAIAEGACVQRVASTAVAGSMLGRPFVSAQTMSDLYRYLTQRP